ncbi:hypothetical protein ACNVED_01025 [Legionella sp. D16C41]|uniref:hypothetical protein n=1 Tax=Legionella sp. D16C41 TaxID=3402688 RepID=UPI003AF6AE77
MYTHNFFSIKIRSIQADISKIRLKANWAFKDNEDTLFAKNAYKGWFSKTRKILTNLEKAEAELTIYEIINYQYQIKKHLEKISYEKSKMHADKRQLLRTILFKLDTLVALKKKELFQTLTNLEIILVANKDRFSNEEVKNFYKQVNEFSKLFDPQHPYTKSYLSKIKIVIEHFITLFKEKFSPNLPEYARTIDSSLEKFTPILEAKFQIDCTNLLTVIKNIINENHDNKLYSQLIKNHRELLAISPGNPVKSYQFYLLLKAFIEDVKNHVDIAPNSEAQQFYQDLYEYLSKLLCNVQQDNLYYLNYHCINKIGQNNLTGPEIKPAHSPTRLGNQVTHYLNAYEDISLPQEQLKGAFPSIIRSIQNAKYLICIEGWEINLHLDYLKPTLKSAKEHEASPYTLGKILVQKAIDNPNLVIAIKVWAQFWDNKLTYHHDSITYLDAIARSQGLKNGLADLPNLQFRAVNHTYNFNTHHSKAVITDAEFSLNDGSKKRKLTAFYGGLDLAQDRMDDCHHTTQKTPNTYGWRDVHQQITGPVVSDLLNDFVSAWQNANNGRLKYWNKKTKDNYCSLERFCRNLNNTNLLNYTNLLRPRALWQSQLLRSTMSASHSNFWVAAKPYERSIAIGYKNAIAEAQHSIELESQYLIGGPGIHAKSEHAESFNPIPQALVDKIIERHKAKVPFHVFITLPMLPNTNSEPGQLEMDSLRTLQWLTMQWMMNQIEQHTGKPWWQFISFNFLAQWYGPTKEYAELAAKPGISRKELINAAQRSPIYVHSKFLTIDNHLMICGSANANERSMRGNGGDSEIAVINRPEAGYELACQEQIIAQRTHNYRVTLGDDFVNKNPLCVIHPELYAEQIRQQALENFKQFAANTTQIDSGSATSKLTTWPFIYSKKIGYVGEYQPGYEYLIDTPKGEEGQDYYRWHPEHFSKALHTLAKFDIRLSY